VRQLLDEKGYKQVWKGVENGKAKGREKEG
jgi:hypothetical protein